MRIFHYSSATVSLSPFQIQISVREIYQQAAKSSTGTLNLHRNEASTHLGYVKV